MKDHFEQWLNQMRQPVMLYSDTLLNDLKDYSNSVDKDITNRKALRVWNKCMLRGKVYIAQAIAEKYPQAIRVKSDAAMVFGFALMVSQRK